jgi:hypothetical protein
VPTHSKALRFANTPSIKRKHINDKAIISIPLFIIRLAPSRTIGWMWQETMLLCNNVTFFYVEKQAGKEKKQTK